MKELDELSAFLRSKRVRHLLIARAGNGISLSSIATGDDIFEFLQCLAEENPAVLGIMQAVIDSRARKAVKSELLN